MLAPFALFAGVKPKQLWYPVSTEFLCFLGRKEVAKFVQ